MPSNPGAPERTRRTPVVYFALGAGAAALVAWLLWPSGSGERAAAVAEKPAPASAPHLREPTTSPGEFEGPLHLPSPPAVWVGLPRASDAGFRVVTTGPADAGPFDPSRFPQNAGATHPQPDAVPAVQHIDDVAIVQGAPLTSRSHNYGNIQGRVRWSGPTSNPPLAAGIDVPVCGYQRPDPSLVTANGGIGNILVETGSGGTHMIQPPDLNISACQFTEHAQVAAGLNIMVNNHDSLDWNIVAHRLDAPGTEDVSLGVPRYGQGARLTLPASGTWVITERRHPWMRAYILVDVKKAMTLTRPDGSFELDYLSPGHHRFTFLREPYDRKASVVKAFDFNVVADESFNLEVPLAPATR